MPTTNYISKLCNPAFFVARAINNSSINVEIDQSPKRVTSQRAPVSRNNFIHRDGGDM